MKASARAGRCDGVPTCGYEPCTESIPERRKFCTSDHHYRERRRRAEALTERRCVDCREVKPVSEFTVAVNGLPMSVCKPCQAARVRARREANPEVVARITLKAFLRRKYDMPIEEWDRRLADQGGCCAICRQPPPQGIRLTVDHDHDTGAVRGLLCGACNTGIGRLGDDAERVAAAAEYLRA